MASYYRRGVAGPHPNTIPFRDQIEEKKQDIEDDVESAFLVIDGLKVARMVRAAFKKRPE